MSAGRRTIVVDTVDAQVSAVHDSLAGLSVMIPDAGSGGALNTHLMGCTSASTMLSSQFANNTLNLVWCTGVDAIPVQLPTAAEFLVMNDRILGRGGCLETWVSYGATTGVDLVAANFGGSDSVKFANGATSLAMSYPDSYHWLVNYGTLSSDTSPCVVITPSAFTATLVVPT